MVSPALTLPGMLAAHAIHRYRVTHFPAAGDVVAQLLATNGNEHAFPSVRVVIGARTGQAVAAQARGLTLIGHARGFTQPSRPPV